MLFSKNPLAFLKIIVYTISVITSAGVMGSEATAASGGRKEPNEWPRSTADEGALSPRKMSGTATGLPLKQLAINVFAGVMELVDVVDSKSTDGDIVPVRVRPPAPR